MVVLADKPKPEMDDFLREGLWGLNLDWHTRSGQPHAISDLAHVAAGQAKTLILLKPENEEVCYPLSQVVAWEFSCFSSCPR